MARRKALKRVWLGWLLGASVVVLAALVAVATQSPLDINNGRGPEASASAGTPPSASQDVLPAGVGGMKAYRDPVTGERVGPPPGPVPPSVPQPSALSRSQVGLEVVPTGTAAGGVRVDLQGRFRSSLVATKRPDGTVSTRCVYELPDIQGEP
jgi:hypothetical protein